MHFTPRRYSHTALSPGRDRATRHNICSFDVLNEGTWDSLPGQIDLASLPGLARPLPPLRGMTAPADWARALLVVVVVAIGITAPAEMA